MPGNWKGTTQPGNGRSPFRIPRYSVAGSQQPVFRGRLCSGVPREHLRWFKCSQGGDGSRPAGPQAVSRLRGRSALDSGNVKRCAAAAKRRMFSGFDADSGERDAPHSASRRHEPADPHYAAWRAYSLGLLRRQVEANADWFFIVAMVFRSYALYLTTSWPRTLPSRRRCPGLHRKTSGEKVAAVAKLLQIEPLLGRKPRELSGGQRQRVAIGPGAGARSPVVPVRRAAVQPRRGATCGAQGRDQAPAPVDPPGHGLYDARPD